MTYSTPCRRGFTLIELLVVIAIMGILAAIVMVNMQGARAIAKDKSAGVRMQNLMIDAQNYRLSNNGAYTNFCTSIATKLTDVQNLTGVAPVCANTATTYKIKVLLSVAGAGYYCVDSARNMGKMTVAAQTANAAQPLCPNTLTP